jgi:alpha-tubulin suppressor-like RCC1 family protein
MGSAKELPESMDMKLFGNQKLVKVVSGSNHTVVLAGNSVWAWGNGESGQTGIDPKSKKKEDQFIPRKFASKNVVDIFTASNHSFLISVKDEKKILKSWGLNNWGQLGVGNRSNFWYPIEIDYFLDNNIQIKSVSGGDFHSIFLTEDSQLYACGKNDVGELGIEITHKPDPALCLESKLENNSEEIVNTIEQAQNIREEGEENFNEPQLTAENPTDMVLNTEIQPQEKQKSSDENQSEWVFTTPVKIEYFTKDNIKINDIYSTMGYNYALDTNNNQAYSWGEGYSYVLGNKDETAEKIPFAISKSFFFNLRIDHVNH